MPVPTSSFRIWGHNEARDVFTCSVRLRAAKTRCPSGVEEKDLGYDERKLEP